jgi:hypothetical protein
MPFNLCMGCNTPSREVSKVRLGMSESEVVRILGEPVSSAETKEGKELYYSLKEGPSGLVGVPYGQYVFMIVDGKLERYGRQGQPPAAGSAPLYVAPPVK